MSDTPRHVSEKVDRILDRLNATYDLRLPRLHGVEAAAALNKSTADARFCSSRIRFLCYRAEEGIDNIIDEFEDEANEVFNKWLYKPSQEKGTIPTLPKDESFLRRDIISNKGGEVTEGVRNSLLQILSKVLDEEFKLARDSKDYQRTSSQSFTDTVSRSTSYTTAATAQQRVQFPRNTTILLTESGSVESMSNKRRKVSEGVKEGKRTKIQQTSIHAPESRITNHFGKTKNAPKDVLPKVAHNSEQIESSTKTTNADVQQYLASPEAVTSFNTAPSSTDSVFSAQQSFDIDSSNDTSIISAHANNSQDLFNTQDDNTYMADVSFCSTLFAADMKTSATSFSFDDLEESSPFGRTQQLPSHLHFWLRWEIYRVAQCTNLLPSFICKEIDSQSKSGRLTYNQFWSIVRSICHQYEKPLPVRSDVRPWMEETGNYESPDGKTAYFTVNLDYVTSAGPFLWTMIRKPITVDKGNRIHRKYGADRHIICYLNYFDKSSLPKWVTQRKDYTSDSFRKLAAWLATKTHHITGRQWRAFYLEPDKKKTKRRQGEMPRQKLSLFAIDGVDFSHTASQTSRQLIPISIAKFMDWHVAFENNLKSTNLKLFSRFGLGLSKTVSTITLAPSQFHYLPDHPPVMNDGCALMSIAMAKAIWDQCGDGTNEIPSAFQGRISGGKGLWVIDYHNTHVPDDGDPIWIQVSESQLKIEPHPRDRSDADETQRTFEVLKWSKPCVSGHLNMQLINILADRGVSRASLRQVVLNDIEEYIEASKGAMRDPRLLAAWLQDYHTINRTEQPASFEHGLPDNKEEEVNFLVQCGFSARTNKFLRESLISLMTQRLNLYVEKLRIEVPHSTSVFCVPDPYGVLEEDEVHLGFSSHWENPKTGFKETALADIDILVARNPAALASDIQKRKAVYKHELRHFKDVIIFPTKGSVPLASLLSGGDYDGDTVTVIWDPELVDSFHNAEKPDLPDEERCGLTKESRRLNDIITCAPASDRAIDELITSCLEFNAQPSRLGICTTELERLVYSGVNLSDPGSILLAALAGYLVDANKQGLSMSEAAWSHVRKVAQADRKIFPLAYKNGQDEPRRWANGECVNIMDFLKFDVAMKRKDVVLAEFENMLPDAQNYDSDLSLIYNREKARTNDTSDYQRSHRTAILEDLNMRLHQVLEEWMKCSRTRLKGSGKNEREIEKTDVSADIRHISNMIKDIVPLQKDCDIYHDFISRQNCTVQAANGNPTEHSNRCAKGTYWSLLRASAMYKLYGRRKITWWIVGDELGRIKAQSQGATREIIPSMHHMLKFDTKLIKRLVGESFNSEEDDGDE